jgi:hypothetical protein
VLLRTLFALILLSALAESFVHGVHALAQAALHRQAGTAVRVELLSAATQARDAVARAIEAGGDPRHIVPVVPALAPVCRLRVRSRCAIEGVAQISFDSATGSSGSPVPCPSSACTIYLQGNDTVDEGRIVATIRAQALAPAGAVLATRSARIAFRTLRVEPFATLAGRQDASLPDVTRPGDDGGAAPYGAAPGTLIDVRYENAVTGAGIPANVWRPQVQSDEAPPPPWLP